MNWQKLLLNCFWLLVPLLAWNAILGPKLTQEAITSDAHSPPWLLATENLTRCIVFGLPLLFPLQMKDPWNRAGLAIYIAGTLIYFASWLPLLLAPTAPWSTGPAGLLAPRLTPFLPLLGIALLAHSWPYALISIAFITLHTWHGIQNL
ncbi:MAG: hypothetical protein ACOYYS_05310 [Chloroflexota bacterium]